MTERENFEVFLLKNDPHRETDYWDDPAKSLTWEAWQASRLSTIQSIQAASKEAVLLPGAIVLPGDFFSKVK